MRLPLPLRDATRERLLEFVAGFPSETTRYRLEALIARMGAACLSDDALQELANEHARSFWRTRRMNRQNRERFKARQQEHPAMDEIRRIMGGE